MTTQPEAVLRILGGAGPFAELSSSQLSSAAGLALDVARSAQVAVAEPEGALAYLGGSAWTIDFEAFWRQVTSRDGPLAKALGVSLVNQVVALAWLALGTASALIGCSQTLGPHEAEVALCIAGLQNEGRRDVPMDLLQREFHLKYGAPSYRRSWDQSASTVNEAVRGLTGRRCAIATDDHKFVRLASVLIRA